ncbi:MAG TPA: hypothetical protein VFB94_25925 [Acidimicrobiales bacterium]|nr:hypothetical protein [Acidimicrobiales bacterium]
MREHCCDEMRRHLEVGDVPAAAAAPGRHVVYDTVFDEYCLVREGGLDAAPISHCPWCGSVLPESKRDLWFAELAIRGFTADDPGLDEAFRTDAWWRQGVPPYPSDGDGAGAQLSPGLGMRGLLPGDRALGEAASGDPLGDALS